MATQAELNEENLESIARQRESRSDRAAARAVKDRRKELLSNATSTKERREIKSGIYDLDTQPRQEDNKEGTDERIQNNGIDRIEVEEEEEEEVGLPEGIEIIWADQTETFIPSSDFFVDYNADSYWSVVFAVSNHTFTQAAPTYDDVQDLWDNVGAAQTKYRLRLITQGGGANVQISAYGQYRESIICVNGDPVTALIKIS